MMKDSGNAVRKATVADLDFIYDIIKRHAQSARLLKRTRNEICHNIENFFISYKKKNKLATGCCSLYIYSQDLAEIRSLVIDQSVRRKGTGSLLINEIEREVRKLRIKKIFALTLAENFFLKNGFDPVEKKQLPEKIWRDCRHCPDREHCIEQAFIKEMH